MLDGRPGKHHVLRRWHVLLTKHTWLAQTLHIVSLTCVHAVPGTRQDFCALLGHTGVA